MKYKIYIAIVSVRTCTIIGMETYEYESGSEVQTSTETIQIYNRMNNPQACRLILATIKTTYNTTDKIELNAIQHTIPHQCIPSIPENVTLVEHRYNRHSILDNLDIKCWGAENEYHNMNKRADHLWHYDT